MNNFDFGGPVICLKHFPQHKTILVGTYEEIILLNTQFQVLDRIKTGSPVRAAVCNMDGVVFIGLTSLTRNPLLMIDQTGQVKEVPFRDVRHNKRDFMVMDLCLDQNDKLWIATAGSSLLYYDGSLLTDYHANNSDVNDDVILSLSSDTTGRGKVWFGTKSRGFGILGMPDWNDKRGRYQLGPDMLQMMLPEYEFKRYWVTQHSQVGRPYLCGQVFDDSDYEEQYEEMLQSSDSSGEGTHVFCDEDDEDDDESGYGRTSLFSNQVKCIAISAKQQVWLGTIGSGIIMFEWNKESMLYHSANFKLPDNDIYTIATDDLGRAWAGTDRGMILIDGSKVTVFNTENSSLDCDEVRSILLTGDHVLIGYNAQSSNVFAYSGSNTISLGVFDMKELEKSGEVVHV